MRVARTALLTVAFLPLAGNVAWACVCDQLAPRQAVLNADAVFTGVASGRSAPARPGFEERVDFIIETVYKGDVPSRWSVSIDASSCAYVFADGERYTVFATADARTDLCMGNVRGSIDPATYGVQPIGVYPSGQLFDFGVDRLALWVVLILVVLGVAVTLRRRRSSSP